jgi:hypothetical protein
MCDANNFASLLILPTRKGDTKIVPQAFNHQLSTIKNPQEQPVELSAGLFRGNHC